MVKKLVSSKRILYIMSDIGTDYIDIILAVCDVIVTKIHSGSLLLGFFLANWEDNWEGFS